MSDTKLKNTLYKKIIDSLDTQRLAEALESLKTLVEATGDWKLSDELKNVASSYSLLLNYMLEGAPDPERGTQRLKFIARCYEIADVAMQQNPTSASAVATKPFSSILKDFEDLGMKQITSGLDAEDIRKHDLLYGQLFHECVSSFVWNAEQKTLAQEFVDSALVPHNDKLLMISALMLSCLYVFDAGKIVFLVNLYCIETDLTMRMRILAAFVLPLQKYRNRLFAYPQVQKCLDLLRDCSWYTADIEALQLAAIECQATHGVEQKMKNEIFPSMLKNNRLFDFQSGKMDIEELDGYNPEWKDIDTSMKKIAELETQGADIFYTSFSSIKHFPFFDKTANWFYPFDISHSAVPENIKKSSDNDIVRVMINNPAFCDSDKYSFCMLAEHICDQQKQMMELKAPDGMQFPSQEASRKTAMRNVLRNAYRFFYLFKGDKPENPFEGDLILVDNPVFKPMFSRASVERIVSCAVALKNFNTAISYIEDFLSKNTADAMLYQKLGYCYQQRKQWYEAISAYEKAYAIDERSQWTLQRLATLNMYVADFGKAAGYFKKLAAGGNTSVNVAMRSGECLAKLGNYGEALHEFFKAEFQEPANAAVLRAIAWCSLMAGNIAQARTYYSKLCRAEPQWGDYVSAGHADLLSGDAKTAYAHYLKAATLEGNEAFLQKMAADKEMLCSKGIKTEDLQLIADAVVMNASQLN
jgi:tetratricopeptide (TPR) repeat protein